MSDFMQRVSDTMKQEQTADEQTLTRLGNQMKDLETKLREREHCIRVLDKALGK